MIQLFRNNKQSWHVKTEYADIIETFVLKQSIIPSLLRESKPKQWGRQILNSVYSWEERKANQLKVQTTKP